MSENQSLLGQLQELLTQKKSKKFYAERLGISEFEVNELLKELREKDNYQNVEVRNYTEERKVNVERGTIESTIVSDFDPKDDLELAKLHKINLDKYVITNYWSKMLPSGKFTSSVFSKKKEAKDQKTSRRLTRRREWQIVGKFST
jgi:2,3-bisphosphoglycerate-independent phosphoglycerate mutase